MLVVHARLPLLVARQAFFKDYRSGKKMMTTINELTNKIICGDAIETMQTIPDKSIDLVVTDPPYDFISKSPVGGGFMLKNNKKHLETINKSFGMSYNPEALLSQLQRVCKKFNAYIFTNKTLLAKYIEFAKVNKYKWEIIVWSKPNPVPINNGHYLIDKEYAVFIKESGAKFNSKCGFEKYFTVFRYSIGVKQTQHPAEKPMKLIRNFIEVSSDKDDLILDCYLGSGTTAIASVQLDRRYIGIDNNNHWCAIATNRVSEAKTTGIIQ
ncbi:MAG: hypothetical protein A2Y12_01250 [Planctomycetes bacterium GWF2_42_9]|nr:MAG: hypothetical protein A2Y12_01250 [Planctomycetes bacterium GWF2_42_9]HAL44815.1 hypothetical protein [Phycisphaerales bacterium]